MLSNTRIKALPLEERDAVRLAMEYWHACWDLESPALFGIDFEEFDQVLHQWPDIEMMHEELTTLAVTASLRELLLGAWAQPKSAIHEIIGIPYSQAVSLLEQLNKT